MVTARNKDRENHQVGVREQPAFSLLSGSFRHARTGAKVLAAGNAVEMFAADAGQTGDFFFGEDFLTRLDGDHFNPPSLWPLRPFGRRQKLRP